MSTLYDPKARANLQERLASVRPDSPRAWGRMSPHQMVCHLGDAFRMVLGEKEVKPIATWFRRTVLRWFAFTSPFPWPKGAPTAPELDQLRIDPPARPFEEDVAALRDLMERFAAIDPVRLDPHPIFGPMSAGEWGRWGYRHVNFHLRQFGA